MKAVVHWNDLPACTIVKLNKNYQIYLLEKLKENYGKQNKIASELKLTSQQIRLYKLLKSNFSVGSLNLIAETLDINKKEIENKIIELGRKRTKIKKPNLPFDLCTP